MCASGWETLLVDVRNLQPQQAAQVFSRTGVRSEAEQRAWIEAQSLKNIESPESDLPYRIYKGEVVFDRPCKITRKDLAELLAKMIE